MKALGGIIPIVPTPLIESGEVGRESFLPLVEASTQDSVHGPAVYGLGCECYKLTDAERASLAEMLVGRTGRRVAVIISITRHAREVAVKRARNAVAWVPTPS